MPTQAKIDAVAELKADFNDAEAIVLTEYRGLSVAQLKELRRRLGDDAQYSVTKNKLTAIAAKEAGVDAFEGQLAGPTAMAFIKGDPVRAAKGLTDFAKANPQLVIKAGLFEGKLFDENKITELAALESREFQLARVAGVLKAPMAAVARAAEALRAKLADGDDTTDSDSDPKGEPADSSDQGEVKEETKDQDAAAPESEGNEKKTAPED